MGREGRGPKEEGGPAAADGGAGAGGEAPQYTSSGGKPRTRPCACCKRVRRRCEGGRPCARCFEHVIPCVPHPGGGSHEPQAFSLDACFASADHQAHAHTFFGAIERLAGQGLCSRGRAITVMGAWHRLSMAASWADVTHGVAPRVGKLLGISVPPGLAAPSAGRGSGAGAPSSSSSSSSSSASASSGKRGGGRAAVTAALTEQGRLLACGEQLEAKGAVRWGPAFESGAILCEALCRDQLALAGNDHLQNLFQDAAGLMAASFQHATLPSLLLASLLDPTCRELWFDSLAYVTFAEHAKPRTHIFKVADREGCIRLFLVSFQRFDVGDGRGGFAVSHRLEPAPDSRYLVPKRAQRLLNPSVPHDDPSEAFAERQQALERQRRTRWGPDGWREVEEDDDEEGETEVKAEGGGLEGEPRTTHPYHSAGAAAAPSPVPEPSYPALMMPRPPPAPVFRGVAAWSGFDADTPAHVWRAVEAGPSALSLAAQAALFAPRSEHHLRLLWECGRGGGPSGGLAAAATPAAPAADTAAGLWGAHALVKEQEADALDDDEEEEEEEEKEGDGGGLLGAGAMSSPLAAMGAAVAGDGGGTDEGGSLAPSWMLGGAVGFTASGDEEEDEGH